MKPTAPDSSPFYTPTQLAAYLKVSNDVVYKQRKFGGGPPFIQVIPRRFLYRKTDVEEWLAERRKLIVSPKPKRARVLRRTTAASHP